MKVGSESGFAMFEVLRENEAVTLKRMNYRLASRRPGDPRDLVSESARTWRELGWMPKSSDLRTIVRSAVKWAHRKGAP
jgi:UDP-glucose 4-epimerase